LRMGPLRTKAKTFIVKARRLLDEGASEDAEQAVKIAVLALDKAAQKGALHKRNASRRKSRLMKRLHVLRSQ